MNQEKVKVSVIYFLITIFLLIITPISSFDADKWCWIKWAQYTFSHGLGNAYKSYTDYLPLYHYVLFIYGKLQGNTQSIADNIHLLKGFTLLFELGSTIILFWLLRPKYNSPYKALAISLAYFLNIAVLYNSLIWGQVDGIFTFFAFSSILLAYYRQLFWALICFVLALNMKLQAIIFLPLFVALIVPVFLETSPKKILISIVSTALLQFFILLPFALEGDLGLLATVVLGSAGKYPYVSMNAYNVWFMLMDGNLMAIENSIEFAGISYKKWGLILFFVSSFLALFYLLKPYYQAVFEKKSFEFSFRKVLISGALIPLLFFFFNTEMHERYSHPAFIFLAAYALLYRKPFLLLLGSYAYFMNLERVYQFFKWEYHTLIFTPWFVACFYLLLIVLLFVDLYKESDETM